MFEPETYWEMVDRVENMEKVRASSSIPLSWEMTRLLTAVIFEGRDIGGPYDDDPRSEAAGDL